jgi:hypothetical protein
VSCSRRGSRSRDKHALRVVLRSTGRHPRPRPVAVASYAIFEWMGAVYYLLAGVLVGNAWEAWRRVNRRTGRTFPRGIGGFAREVTPWRAGSDRGQTGVRPRPTGFIASSFPPAATPCARSCRGARALCAIARGLRQRHRTRPRSDPRRLDRCGPARGLFSLRDVRAK